MGSHVVLEAQRVMAESQYDVARSFYLLGDSVPWNSSHVVLEAQRVMAGSQCDMACSFCALFGCFGAFGLVPRRVGGPTRHGGLPIRRGALVCSLLGCFGVFGVEPRRVGGPTRHGGLPMRRDALVLPPFGAVRLLWARATSCWRPNTTWRAPNTTWRARFTLFLGDLDPWNSTHVVLEAQRVMAGSQCDVTRFFYLLSGCFGAFVWALQQKSHLRARSEVAGFMLI